MTDTAMEQVRELYRNWIQSWNEKNVELMTELMSEDGNMVGFDGSQMNGRKEIQSTIGQIFKDYPTGQFIHVIKEVRMLGNDAAILRAVAGMVPRGYSEINPAVNSIQTLVAHRRGGEWEIEMFQNTPAAFHGRPEEVEALSKELREALARNPFPVHKGH